MYIQKKPKWNIFCQIKHNISDSTMQKMRLSFTTHDYLNFIPPNGHVTDFNIHTELLNSNVPKLEAGVYGNTHACCLIISNPNGISIHGASHQWEKLKELLAKILSSASMRPRVAHEKNTLTHQLMIEWSEALFALQK